ncbi:MAG: phosphatidylglycerol---prolipoprotein diacylglyceryl transferase [Acidobacteriota bacterium]|jgi:prolipoprotein diacylglyceryltransferase|nr:phosphatidylglycerol---prolipoprotein diacylglyceryl transferase [Acidobacteriota bacterium]
MQWTGNLAVHQLLEMLAYLAGGLVYATQRARRGDVIDDTSRFTVIAGAAVGAMIGTRLLFWLCDPRLTLAHLTDPNYLFGGKTVVGGLLGGLIGVEIAKKMKGITRSTGDLFVEPLIVAMCIGRIGCFLAGPLDHTAGKPTSLPWGIAIGDRVPRHPVALYEIAFLLVLLGVLRSVRSRLTHEGDSFRIFMSGYFTFRFAIDFLKPDPPPLAGGLTAIQWACLAALGYYALVLTDDRRHASIPLLRRGRVNLHDVLPED